MPLPNERRKEHRNELTKGRVRKANSYILLYNRLIIIQNTIFIAGLLSLYYHSFVIDKKNHILYSLFLFRLPLHFIFICLFRLFFPSPFCSCPSLSPPPPPLFLSSSKKRKTHKLKRDNPLARNIRPRPSKKKIVVISLSPSSCQQTALIPGI